jgi:NADPH:quinone reductase-like Zn-dependent oxidoreductase
MRAIIHTQYGPPAVAQLKELPKPLPADHELLIKVFASTVNRTDSGFRSAEYFVSRFWSGLLKPNYQTLGCEFAGVVEAIGEG